MTKARDEKRVYWANHVKQWKESGESKRSYARRHTLKPDQLGYWVQVLEAKPQANKTKSFVAVHVTPPPSIHNLTIKLPNGLRVEGIHFGNLDITRALIGSLI